MKIFLISLIITNSIFAQSVPLKEGDKAPFDGVLLDNKQANSLKNAVIENDGLKKVNNYLGQISDLQKKNSDIDADKLKMLSQQNDNLAKQVQDARSTSTWEKIAYIALGVVAASVGAYVVSKAAR